MQKNKKFMTMDGNEAAAYSSYAFTEVAVYTPLHHHRQWQTWLINGHSKAVRTFSVRL